MRMAAVTLIVLVGLAVYSAFLLVAGFILQWLWNWVIVGVFNTPQLGYWYAVGLVLLLTFIGGFFKSSKK